MRMVTIGDWFKLPMLLYDIFLYGGILLTLISIGMMIFGAIKKKGKKYYKVWFMILIAGVLMLVPIVLAMIYGLGESIA